MNVDRKFLGLKPEDISVVDRLTLPLGNERVSKIKDRIEKSTIGDNETIPLSQKFPLPKKVLKGQNITFTRGKLSKKLNKTNAQKQFIIEDENNQSRVVFTPYNALHDPQLETFFSQPERKAKLKKLGLISETGDVICNLRQFNNYRKYLAENITENIKTEIREEDEEQVLRLKDLKTTFASVKQQQSKTGKTDKVQSKKKKIDCAVMEKRMAELECSKMRLERAEQFRLYNRLQALVDKQEINHNHHKLLKEKHDEELEKIKDTIINIVTRESVIETKLKTDNMLIHHAKNLMKAERSQKRFARQVMEIQDHAINQEKEEMRHELRKEKRDEKFKQIYRKFRMALRERKQALMKTGAAPVVVDGKFDLGDKHYGYLTGKEGESKLYDEDDDYAVEYEARGKKKVEDWIQANFGVGHENEEVIEKLEDKKHPLYNSVWNVKDGIKVVTNLCLEECGEYIKVLNAEKAKAEQLERERIEEEMRKEMEAKRLKEAEKKKSSSSSSSAGKKKVTLYQNKDNRRKAITEIYTKSVMNIMKIKNKTATKFDMLNDYDLDADYDADIE